MIDRSNSAMSARPALNPAYGPADGSGPGPRPSESPLDVAIALGSRNEFPHGAAVRALHGSQRRGRRPHADVGRSLRGALNEGGLTFIKFGQILSTRRDLLPAEVVEELSALQHQAAYVPWPQIEAVLVAEYGDLDRVFARVDREPM